MALTAVPSHAPMRPDPLLPRLILAVMLLGAGAAARAQEVRPVETEAQRCVRLVEDVQLSTPEYPFEEFKAGREGRVVVDLSFSGPQAAPKVERLTMDGDADFGQSVRRFVAGLRVPCMAAGGPPARLRYEYVFKSDDRKSFASPPKDPAYTPERFACLTSLQVDYPVQSAQRGAQGRVLVRFRFEAPDQPPQYEVLAAHPAGPLARAVQDHFARVRMPCIGDQPVSGELVYVFLLDGESSFGFQPHTSFQQFLGALTPEDRKRLPASNQDMACPFDVRLHYRRPATDNRVFELGNHDPRRQPFLAWLREVRLASRAAEPSVFADEISFQIPCYSIQ